MRGRELHRRMVIQTGNAAYSFGSDMVLYVEADDKVCTLHMANRTMAIRRLMEVPEAVLPHPPQLSGQLPVCRAGGTVRGDADRGHIAAHSGETATVRQEITARISETSNGIKYADQAGLYGQRPAAARIQFTA